MRNTNTFKQKDICLGAIHHSLICPGEKFAHTKKFVFQKCSQFLFVSPCWKLKKNWKFFNFLINLFY